MTSFHPATVSFLIQPITQLLSPRRFAVSRSEAGDLLISLSPKGFSLYTLNRFAVGTLALSTQYYLYHDTLHLIPYTDEWVLALSLVISLLGLTSILMGFKSLSEGQQLELVDGQLIYQRDRFLGQVRKVIPFEEIASLTSADKFLFRDQLLHLDVPIIQLWSGQSLPVFEYASPTEKRKLFHLLDQHLYQAKIA